MWRWQRRRAAVQRVVESPCVSVGRTGDADGHALGEGAAARGEQRRRGPAHDRYVPTHHAAATVLVYVVVIIVIVIVIDIVTCALLLFRGRKAREQMVPEPFQHNSSVRRQFQPSATTATATATATSAI